MNVRRIGILAAALVLVFLFAGCDLFGGGNAEPENTLPPVVIDENAGGEVVPVGQEPETAGTKLTADELKALDKMLFGNKAGENWLLRSIPVLWENDPCDIDLSVLFYNGFEGEKGNFTDDELYYISDMTGYSVDELMNMGQLRLPDAKMDAVLREYYGTTLMDTSRSGLGYAVYWSDTNSYYLLHSGDLSPNFAIHSAYEQDDGGFIIYYGNDQLRPEPEYVMVITPNEFGTYTILYNKPVTEN